MRRALTLARVDAGQERLTLETVALDELVQGVLETLTPLAEQRGVKLSSGLTGASRDRWRSNPSHAAIVNLVDNGLKYTQAGGAVTCQFAAPTQRRHRSPRYRRGIPADDVPHIFERFYRVDAGRARSEGGTGLGLAICEWIAQAHGGQISVHSVEGQDRRSRSASRWHRALTRLSRSPVCRGGVSPPNERDPPGVPLGGETPPLQWCIPR